MNQPQWTAVDRYITDLFVPPDPALDAALQATTDADKPSTTAYFEWTLKLTWRGSLIIADNVVRDGAVIDAHSTDASVQGVRRFNAALAAEPRVTASVIQTVGSKGYDGLAFAVVTG